jgi:parvulin-like peptidyl-prolyl isomerase
MEFEKRGYGSVVLALVFLALTLAACDGKSTATRPSKTDNPVLAVLNDREIHRSDFEAFVRIKEIDFEDALVPIPRKELFRDFMVDQLLLQAALREGIQVTDEELRTRFGDFLDKDLIDPTHPEVFQNFLKVEKFVRQRISSVPKITAEQMERYYREHQGEFVVDDRIRVLEILVPEEQQAVQLRSQLRPKDFRTFRSLAREHSRGLTAERGGDLGTFEAGELPEIFDKAVFKLKLGQISPALRSEHGYHLFMVEEVIPRHPQPFQEVQRVIFEKMLAQEQRDVLENYLDELLRNASVEIREPGLQFEWRMNNAKGD